MFPPCSPFTIITTRSHSLSFTYLLICILLSIFTQPIFLSNLIPPLCSFISIFFPYSLHLPFAFSHFLLTASFISLFLRILFFHLSFHFRFSLPLFSFAVSPFFLSLPNCLFICFVLCLSSIALPLSSFTGFFLVFRIFFYFSLSRWYRFSCNFSSRLLSLPLHPRPSLSGLDSFLLSPFFVLSGPLLPPPSSLSRKTSASGPAVSLLPTTNKVRHLGPLTYRMFALLPTVGFSLSHPAPPDLLRHRPRPASTSRVPPSAMPPPTRYTCLHSTARNSV